MQQGPPPVGNFLSSREYVTAFDIWAKRGLKSYSRRNFAKRAGVRSPNFITLVISGKRALQGEWLEAFVRAAKLSAKEERLLKELCAIEHEKNPNAKAALLNDYYNQLLARHQHKLATSQMSLLRNPLAWTLLQVISLKGAEDKAGWFKKILRLPVDAPTVVEALEILRTCGLIEKRDSRWIATHKHYKSPDQISVAENAVFHECMLREAAEVLKSYDPGDRSFGSLTFNIAREDEVSLKAEIQKFGQHIAKTYSRSYPASGDCFRLNLQLYALTNTENE
jgi:uncharacterized protein (TIGR02147 family)